MVDIPVNSQRNPVGYLARKFAINYNITKLVNIAGTAPATVPNLSATSALALAAYALLRLRTAQLAVTDDVGGAWDAELAAAQTLADKALAEVSASQGSFFPTAQRIFTKLQTYADNNNAGSIPAPGDLAADWATSRGALPVAAMLTVSQANHVALDIDLLSGVTNAETTEDVVVTQVAGRNWEEGETVEIGGIEFTMDTDFHLTADAPGQALAQTDFIAVISDGVSADVNRTIRLTITNTAPTANAIVTTVANNTAISKNFLTLSSGADANSDTIRITEINGVDVPTPFAAGNYEFTVDGKVFTLAKETGVVTAAAQAEADTWTGTFKIGDNDPVDPKETAATNWSIENLAP